jgi:integrase
MDWLKTLTLAPKSKAHLKRMLHLLFERAMLWGLVEVARNPLELVRVKGGSKRKKQPTVLTPEEFKGLAANLAEPYRVMATVAVCTGLRISEVLALRWEHIDFNAGTMLVQQGVVNGRIGKTKTEASRDEIPLDGISLTRSLIGRLKILTRPWGWSFQVPSQEDASMPV